MKEPDQIDMMNESELRFELRTVLNKHFAAVAEFRNIIDDCATAPSRGWETSVERIHRYAVSGLGALDAK